MKLTEWFDGSVKPARPGVYQKDIAGVAYAYWNGNFWGMFTGSSSFYTPRDALKGANSRSIDQTARWRGLAEDPRKA